MGTNRVFTPEFRLSIVKRIQKGEKVRTLSQELKIRRTLLYRWCDSYRREGGAGLERGTGRPPRSRNPIIPGKRKTDAAEAARGKMAELERRLGRMTLENDFLKEPSSESRKHTRRTTRLAACGVQRSDATGRQRRTLHCGSL